MHDEYNLDLPSSVFLSLSKNHFSTPLSMQCGRSVGYPGRGADTQISLLRSVCKMRKGRWVALGPALPFVRDVVI